MTLHAKQRAAQRVIPDEIISLILEYGEARNAGDAAEKFALTRVSLRQIRRELGRGATPALSHYRKAYIVAARGRVITAAFAARHPFH